MVSLLTYLLDQVLSFSKFGNANFRYNACWLPLLAKQSESQISEGFLVVPLDCEWIWHCHRLNPVSFLTGIMHVYLLGNVVYTKQSS